MPPAGRARRSPLPRPPGPAPLRAPRRCRELLVTSMDRDGTKSGFDLELLRALRGRVRLP
ncbi:HisA/HisF-related TIM barrel protein, partial [Pseudoroseomonas aestuarii]|uniref:HisA/HisF-related TIM barrel protein n=1 Tax=Teichococcus aestuarii TaxID=568898 RepID=UPI00360C474E